MPGTRGEEKTSVVLFYLVFFGVLFFDQLTKFLALRFLNEAQSIPLIPQVFHLTLVYNTGIAFGFFREHPSILLGLITLSLVILFIWGWKHHHMRRSQRYALAAILGGAVGNWLDRLRFGAVIDFFDFRVWPVFNVADCAITVGVAVFVTLAVLRRNQ